MTDKRDEDTAGKNGDDQNPKSGAGYGDHADEKQKSDAGESGEEKGA